jgi:hypothetical protein
MSVSNLQFKTPPRAAAKAVNVLLILGSYGGYFFIYTSNPTHQQQKTLLKALRASDGYLRTWGAAPSCTEGVLFTGYIDLANNQSRLVELMIADGMMGATRSKTLAAGKYLPTLLV